MFPRVHFGMIVSAIRQDDADGPQVEAFAFLALSSKDTHLSRDPLQACPRPCAFNPVAEMKLFLLLCSLVTIISAVNDRTEIIRNVQNQHSHSVSLNRQRKHNVQPKQPFPFLPEKSSLHINRLSDEPKVSNATETGFSSLRFDGVNYLTSITIGAGSTARTFNLVVDLFDSETWVFSDQLPANQGGVQNRTLYQAGETSTSTIVPGETWDQTWLAAIVNVAGGVYTDTINLGGLSISKATVEAVNSTALNLTDISYDGALGLSTIPTSSSPISMPRLIDQIANSTNIQLPVFTTLFTRLTEPPGFITFGYINSTLVDTDIKFTRVLSAADSRNAKFWAFASEFAIVNKKTFDLPGRLAYVTSTFPGITTDPTVAEAIYEVILGSRFIPDEGYVFPASTTHFPNVTFPVGTSSEITLQGPADFILGPSSLEGFVIGTIQAGGPVGATLLGTRWLQKVYAVFDIGMTGRGNLRFGVVPRRPLDG